MLTKNQIYFQVYVKPDLNQLEITTIIITNAIKLFLKNQTIFLFILLLLLL